METQGRSQDTVRHTNPALAERGGIFGTFWHVLARFGIMPFLAITCHFMPFLAKLCGPMFFFNPFLMHQMLPNSAKFCHLLPFAAI
jgi:hypothetical protein